MAADGLDAAFLGGGGAFVRAEHEADAGAVNVAIAEADLAIVFFAAEGDGEIGGDGGFADAALAAGDGR